MKRLKNFFTTKYRIEVRNKDGETLYYPQKKNWYDLEFFDYTYTVSFSDYDWDTRSYKFSTQEEAEVFIQVKIKETNPSQEKVVGYYEYKPISQKIDSVVK
jgi:hypothetical protein